MKKTIEFLKKQPLITGLIGMIFISLSVRYLGPRMVGNLEAGAFRLALALSAVVFLYLISREKAFEKCNNRTGYVLLVLLPTLIVSIIGFFGKFAELIMNGAPLANGWFTAILIITFEYICVGLLEEISARGLINDALLYQFRDSKMSTKSLFVTIALVDTIVFGAVHVIGSDFSTMSAVGFGLLKIVSSGIGSLAYLLMYWKTRNLWAIAIAHGLLDYLIDFPSTLLQEVGNTASNTQDYVSMTGNLAVANLGMQLIVIVIDAVVCIWIWKKHMKDVDFEEIRRTW